MTTPYNIFAPFYDATMGDRTQTAERLRAFIKETNPQARSVLELACGTGAVLKILASDYVVSGLDVSARMLDIARKNIPQATFHHQSMVDLALTESYDIVLCVFDSINHLLDFRDWETVFARVHEHLNDNGVFIFDINTIPKLSRVINEPAGVREFHSNLLVMNVTDIGNGISNWNIKVFEHIRGHEYTLHEENIREVSFPEDQVLTSLTPLFVSVKVIDSDEDHPKKKGERLFFICRK